MGLGIKNIPTNFLTLYRLSVNSIVVLVAAFMQATLNHLDYRRKKNPKKYNTSWDS